MNTQPESRKTMDVRQGQLDDLSYKILNIANIVMLLTVVLHDADHCRQAMNWGYTIGLSLWVINCLVYVPNAIALFLTHQRRQSAALVTCMSGLGIAIAFARVHLLGAAGLPIWGIWNKSFFELGADAISWSVLAFTVIVGVGVGVAGSYVMGRLSATTPIH